MARELQHWQWTDLPNGASVALYETADYLCTLLAYEPGPRRKENITLTIRNRQDNWSKTTHHVGMLTTIEQLKQHQIQTK